MDLHFAAIVAANPKLEELFILRANNQEHEQRETWTQAVQDGVILWSHVVGDNGLRYTDCYFQWKKYYQEHGRITDGLTDSSSDCSQPKA